MTQVVHVNRAPFDVYIGRKTAQHAKSIFANPYKVGRDGTRSECIAKFKEELDNDPELQKAAQALKGKTLGCWCKPQDCHGDVLVEFLDGPAPTAADSSWVQPGLFSSLL